MSQNHCVLCASDEGLFLSVDAKDHHFYNKLETCLSAKIGKKDKLSSKICHKCAYELDQCNKFVEDFKKNFKGLQKSQSTHTRGLCTFCLQGQKSHLFKLDPEWSKSQIEKLQKIFTDNVIPLGNITVSICLNCRYNLDVLFDLRNLYQESRLKLKSIIEGDSDIPKTKTLIIQRKTTSTQSARFTSCLSESDTDFSTMVKSTRNMSKLKIKKSPPSSPMKMSPRKCDQCEEMVENGVDMYRIHKTGLKVCKTCWTTTDVSTSGMTSLKRKRQVSSEAKDTKLCTIFLKDVLTESSVVDEKTSDKTTNDVTSESGIENDKTPMSKKMKKELIKEMRLQNLKARRLRDKEQNNNANSQKRANTDTESNDGSRTLRKRKRINSVDSSLEPQRRLRSANSAEPSTSSKKVVKGSVEVSSDSEAEKVASGSDVQRQRPRRAKTKVVSMSDVETRRKKTKPSNIKGSKSLSEDSSSNNEDMIGKLGYSVKSKELGLKGGTESFRRSSRIRSSSGSINDLIPMKFKSPTIKKARGNLSLTSKTSPKDSRESESMEKRGTSKEKFPCNECGVVYQNKILCMKHELTHFKQLALKLSRVKESSESQSIETNENSENVDIESKESVEKSSNEGEKETDREATAETRLVGVSEISEDTNPLRNKVSEESENAESEKVEEVKRHEGEHEETTAKEEETCEKMEATEGSDAEITLMDVDSDEKENVMQEESECKEVVEESEKIRVADDDGVSNQAGKHEIGEDGDVDVETESNKAEEKIDSKNIEEEVCDETQAKEPEVDEVPLASCENGKEEGSEKTQQGEIEEEEEEKNEEKSDGDKEEGEKVPEIESNNEKLMEIDAVEEAKENEEKSKREQETDEGKVEEEEINEKMKSNGDECCLDGNLKKVEDVEEEKEAEVKINDVESSENSVECSSEPLGCNQNSVAEEKSEKPAEENGKPLMENESCKETEETDENAKEEEDEGTKKKNGTVQSEEISEDRVKKVDEAKGDNEASSDSKNVAAELLEEILDNATKGKGRGEDENCAEEDCDSEAETVENISKELEKTAKKVTESEV